MSAGLYIYKFNNKKRECDECGKKYTPKAANQKYCEKCRRMKYAHYRSGPGKEWGGSTID